MSRKPKFAPIAAGPLTPAPPPREALVAITEKRAVKARQAVDAGLAEIASAARPIEALRWSSGLFNAAAALDVFAEVHAALTATDSKATVASVREWALEMLLSATKHTASSTSVTANLAETLAAPHWAEVYEQADWLSREPS